MAVVELIFDVATETVTYVPVIFRASGIVIIFLVGWGINVAGFERLVGFLWWGGQRRGAEGCGGRAAASNCGRRCPAPVCLHLHLPNPNPRGGRRCLFPLASLPPGLSHTSRLTLCVCSAGTAFRSARRWG